MNNSIDLNSSFSIINEMEMRVPEIERVIPLSAIGQFLIVTKNCTIQLWHVNDMLLDTNILSQLNEYRKTISDGYNIKESEGEHCSFNIRGYCESPDSTKILLYYNIQILTSDVGYGWEICSIFVELVLRDLSVSKIVPSKPISSYIEFDKVHDCYISKYSKDGATAKFDKKSLKVVDEMEMFLYDEKFYVDNERLLLIGKGFDSNLNIWSLQNYVKLQSILINEKIFDFVFNSKSQQVVALDRISNNIIIYDIGNQDISKIELIREIHYFYSLKIFLMSNADCLLLPYSVEHTIDVYDLKTMSYVTSIDHDDYIEDSKIEIDKHQNSLYTITSDNTLRKFTLI